MNMTIDILESLKLNDEENGFYSIKTKYGEQFFNIRGKYIIDCINRHDDIESIILKYKMQYNVTEDIAKHDVIALLNDMKIVGLIDFTYSKIKYNTRRKNIFVAGECEYPMISKVINNNLKDNKITWVNNAIDDSEYSPYIIRTRGFYNQTNYFFNYDKNNIVKTIIGIQNINQFKISMNIQLIQTTGEKKEIISFFSLLENELIKLEKCKIRLVVSDKSDKKIFNLMSDLHFVQEGYLQKEDGFHNFYLYSKILKEHQTC